MRAAYLPGGRRVDLREVDTPVPGPGQVLVRVRASTICGSDIRAIYREHLGTGAEAYQGVVGGHEPAGEVVEVGPGCRERAVGDRVVVYHISGCGLCRECRRGYQISCTGSGRAGYGWQRDGGHADFVLAEERDLLPLPDALTFVDGAIVACGGATAYEALRRAEVSGDDSVLVTGLGPVGQLVGLFARAHGSGLVVGTDPSPQRRRAALDLGAVHVALDPGDAAGLGEVLGEGADVAVDASGAGPAQLQALELTRRWGRTVLVGEGGRLSVDVSEVIIHKQLTVHGSWVASTWRTADLLERLPRWGVHPEVVVTHRFGLDEVARAYEVADSAAGGKVAVLPHG
ncbi:zinc-binding dehydrogenase [Kineococcus glutinatus]|uniref:Zinc-binding dehydrogenase n=1 Tax=Kineococcus glutinatus TaxID=1070872 RepID=A0ABP9HUF2_9ACTN